MFDINTILTQTLAAAVAEATKPLVERIATLEGELSRISSVLNERVCVVQERGIALEATTKPLVERIDILSQHSLTLSARVAALEAQLAAQATPAPQIDEVRMVEALNSQEWFWEKVRRFADAAAIRSITNHEDSMYHYDKDAVETLIREAVTDHEDSAPHLGHNVLEAKIDAAIDAALGSHLENQRHFDEDDIDTKIEEAIEKHEENKAHGDEDDIETFVQRLLNSASISISV